MSTLAGLCYGLYGNPCVKDEKKEATICICLEGGGYSQLNGIMKP